MLHSIYDLTTLCRKTSGDVPPKLVGASTTVIGSKMYLFGGRLVTERRMTSDLYMFDLETFEWEFIQPASDDDTPRPRYFHSTDSWNNYLVLFGGMSNRPDSANPEDLCVLSDVRFFDLESRHWLPEAPSNLSPDDPNMPRARYAHLSSITANRLFVIGGQDFFNTWLDDVCVYDLVNKTWVQRREYPRHCGTYRSVAVSSTSTVRIPQDEILASHASSVLGPSGTRLQMDKSAPLTEVTPSNTLTHLPYTAEPTDEHPSEIFLYSNYNFTDVKRELEVFSPLPDADFTIDDRSEQMTGSTLPPGLRFPTGAVLGTHLIIAGTYLAHSYQSFSIWVLDLVSMTWSRIDPGKAIETGSWFRGCLWAEGNKFLIFGNRNGNLVDDYNRRLLSWDHVAAVDLEAFGIYQPPPLKLDIRMQELGLAALEEKSLADFEIVCDDGRKIPCSRKILEERWPWFKLQRTRMLQRAQAALDRLPTSAMHVDLPVLPGIASVEETQLDPRLTPRALFLSEPWPVTMALLQYFYSMALITPLQHAPAVLSQLLILGATYQLDHLVSLVKHAMHRALSNSTSVGVYEVATLCSCRSLQIRALKTVMSYTQKKPSKPSRHERENGHDRHSGGPNGGTNGTAGRNGDSQDDGAFSSRPRGTSDARWRTPGGSGPPNGASFMSRGGSVLPQTLVEEHSEAQRIRVKASEASRTHRSSGSAPSQIINYSRQTTPLPLSSTREKHMVQDFGTNHPRAHSSTDSDEWSFVPSFKIAPGTQQTTSLSSKSAPTTPSKKQALPKRVVTGNLVDPKLPVTPRQSRLPIAPGRHRPLPIFTGAPTASVGKSCGGQPRHTPNLSSSSSQSSFSSSSNDLKTPITPTRSRRLEIAKVVDPQKYSSGLDADESFTLVLNEEEAIHWTKQTSDLRQSSPTRPSFTGQSTPDFSPYPSSSPQPKLHLLSKLASSPFKSANQTPANPAPSENRKAKGSQKSPSRFGFGSDSNSAQSRSPLSHHSPPQQEEFSAMYQGLGRMAL